MKKPNSYIAWFIYSAVGCLVMLPLTLSALEGMQIAKPTLVLTAFGALFCFLGKGLERLASLIPYAALAMVFAVMHREVGERYEIWTFIDLAVLAVWAMVASALVSEGLDTGFEGPVMVAWILVSFLSVAAALDLARNGFAEAVRMEGIQLNRSNPDLAVSYLFGLQARNVLIGVLPLTIAGAAGCLMMFTRFPGRLKLVFIGLGLLALVPSVLMGTRTLLGTIIALSVVMAGWSLRNAGNQIAVLGSLIIVIVGFVGTVYYFPNFELTEMIGRRFMEIPSDPRLLAWEEAIVALRKMPLGGGMHYYYAGNLKWAHNVILDVSLTAGMFAAVLLIGSWLVAGMRFSRLWRNNRLSRFDLVLMAANVVSILASLVMPPILGLYALQLFSLFYFVLRAKVSPEKVKTLSPAIHRPQKEPAQKMRLPRFT